MIPLTIETTESNPIFQFTRDSRFVKIHDANPLFRGGSNNWFDLSTGLPADSPAAKSIAPELPDAISFGREIGSLLGLDWGRAAVRLGDDAFVSVFRGSFSRYNLKTKKLLRDYPRLGVQYVSEIHLTPNYEHLVSCCCMHAGGQEQRHCVRITEVESGREYPLLSDPSGGDFLHCAVSPDGKYLLANCGSDVRVWEFTTLLQYLASQSDPDLENARKSLRVREELLAVRAHGVSLDQIYALNDAMFPGQVQLESVENFEAYKVLQADTAPVAPLEVSVCFGSKLYDILKLGGSVACTEKVFRVFEQHGFKGWERLPLRIKWKKSQQPPETYYGLRATSRVGPIVEAAREASDDRRYFVDLRTWDGGDIFFNTDRCQPLVTARVIDALKEAGITGWKAMCAPTGAEILGAMKPPKPAKTSKQTKTTPAAPAAISGTRTSTSDLKKLIAKFELSRVAGKILESAQPALAFSTKAATAANQAVGASRFGGQPDLPKDSPWPVLNNRPLAFLAQIRLSDVSKELDSTFPKAGLLSFFADIKGDATYWSVEQGAVLYHSENTSLQTIPFPASLPDFHQLDPRAFLFKRILSIPRYMAPLVTNVWKLSEEEVDQYMDLYDALGEKNPVRKHHQLGGWPLWLQFDDTADKRGISKQLLLQVDTDSTLGVTWGDGILYSCLEPQKLAAKNFTQATVAAQYT